MFTEIFFCLFFFFFSNSRSFCFALPHVSRGAGAGARGRAGRVRPAPRAAWARLRAARGAGAACARPGRRGAARRAWGGPVLSECGCAAWRANGGCCAAAACPRPRPRALPCPVHCRPAAAGCAIALHTRPPAIARFRGHFFKLHVQPALEPAARRLLPVSCVCGAVGWRGGWVPPAPSAGRARGASRPPDLPPPEAKQTKHKSKTDEIEATHPPRLFSVAGAVFSRSSSSSPTVGAVLVSRSLPVAQDDAATHQSLCTCVTAVTDTHPDMALFLLEAAAALSMQQQLADHALVPASPSSGWSSEAESAESSSLRARLSAAKVSSEQPKKKKKKKSKKKKKKKRR